MQCLSSDCEFDKTILQYAPNLSFTHIEDLVRTTQREMKKSRNAVDGSAHVLISAGGPGNFPAPGYHQGDWDGPGKSGGGQEQPQGQGWGGPNIREKMAIERRARQRWRRRK